MRARRRPPRRRGCAAGYSSWVVALVAAIGLIVWLSYSFFGTGTVSASLIAQRAEQGKTSMLSGISQGQILYYKDEFYQRRNPSLPEDAPFVYHGSWTMETWMAANAAGETMLHTSVMRNSDGEMIAYHQIEGDEVVSTWVATGDKVGGLPAGHSLTAWVRGAWTLEANQSQQGRSRVVVLTPKTGPA